MNLECSDGTYGKECQDICGYCADLDVCHHTNGSCPNGCEAGYQGIFCKARKLACCYANRSPMIKNDQIAVFTLYKNIYGILRLMLLSYVYRLYEWDIRTQLQQHLRPLSWWRLLFPCERDLSLGLWFGLHWEFVHFT